VTVATFAVLSGLSSLGATEYHEARVARSDTPPATIIEVPFVAQGPLLCGGAAAAMVERFWGVRGVYGEDFRHLVREEEGGIRTSELARAMQERGYLVRISSDEPDRVFAALEEGIPPILLLESGATRLHYVVLVGLEDGNVWIHDPNFGPRRELSRDELLRRWATSGHWALVIVPTASPEDSPPVGGTSEAHKSEPGRATPALVTAMERLRAGDTEGARVTARTLLDAGEGEATIGRRILATGWFLDGEPSRALQEWNALGEPAIDLVRIDGLESTRYHVARDRLSLAHGEILTAASLALAGRRLAHLPSIQASLVDYRPLPDGTVEVRARVLERSRVPGYAPLVVKGIGGLVNHRAGLEVGPLMAAGDRWRFMGSWEAAQRYAGGSVSAPAPPLPGIATVGVEWRRERFGVTAPCDGARTSSTEKRLRGSLELQEWIHPRVRLGTSLALESWTFNSAAGAARLFNAGLVARWTTDDDRSWLVARGDAWTGSERSFGRSSLEAGTTIPQGASREWRLRGGGIVVSPRAPRMVWPGAGSGRIREPLLRAHGLVEDDVIQGPAFGRELLHATVEHRVFWSAGPARLGASLFVDGAHARSRGGTASDRSFVDVGTGIFLDMGPHDVALNVARGSAGWRLSAQVGGQP
jgi:hypothetical protein